MPTIGVDIGGTFTDLVIYHRGRLTCLKLPSTPKNPAQAVLRGLGELWPDPRNRKVVHGTTVGTNALLTGTWSKTGMVTTAGFEDVIEIGRQQRPELYNLFVEKPKGLVPTRLRVGIRERTTIRGQVVLPLDKNEARRALERLRGRGVQAVAICLLNSFAQPAHEEQLLALASRLGLEGCASCQVLPEFREYERFATTVINAALLPLMGKYLGRLEEGLGGSPLRIMQSNGGAIGSAAARKLPVRTILSGPAGGVVGAAHVARIAGYERVITFDMGGTSTDVCLVDGQPVTRTDSQVAGYPLKVPVLDIHSVGAGGGSIASVDEGGALRVGPESAGSDPGPICYGRGRQVTITDANLYLGRLDPSRFLGGAFPLNLKRVELPLVRLGRSLGLDPAQTASGIVEVANATMERAIRVISIERGHDPREYSLVSFGGAGGLHACDLAARMNIPRVLIPREPGALSAAGMLMADVMRDYSRTVLLKLSRVNAGELRSLFEPLLAEARAHMVKEGITGKGVKLIPSLDIRYEGQSYELPVPLKKDRLFVTRDRFDLVHKAVYGYSHPDRECEVVNLRLVAVGKVDKPRLGRLLPLPGVAVRACVARKAIYFEGRWFEGNVYEREKLGPGDRLQGPAIVVEYSATHFLPPGSQAQVDPWGNIVIEV